MTMHAKGGMVALSGEKHFKRPEFLVSGESVTQVRTRPFDSLDEARRRFVYPGRKKDCL